MNANTSNPEKFVRAQHWATQAAPPLGVLAAGLLITLGLLWFAHPAFGPVADWRHLGIAWLAMLAATVIGAAAMWRARRRSLLHSAAETDAAFATHNRLEAAIALNPAQSPLARAQREETEKFLQSAQLSPRRRGLAAWLGLCTVLALAHIVTLVCWARPMAVDLAAKKDGRAAEKKAVAPPTASIEWQAPEPEAAATAIEEVPLEAAAEASTGLRDVRLEIEVNGEHRLSQPLNDDLSQPGRHTLKPSIYLDQLNVKTYDMVSYHLRAQRIFSANLPETVSPVQFVQIKPMREDTFICAGGDQPSKCFNYVTALKAAQLQLMKENFALAHAEISTASDEWRQENSRVGGNQTQLADKTGEVIQLMGGNNYPSPILDLVRQAEPLMRDASQRIVKTENEPALAPQGKALSDLTEVERYLKNAIKLAGQSKQAKANDPFQKPKNLDLKTHPLTRAGKVEALAKAQAQLAGDLASGNTNATFQLVSEDAKPEADQIAGTPAERQAEIKKRIEDMLEDPAFKEDALKHLQASDELAGKSQEQIGQQDLGAASEPAAEAARELRQTAAALRADDGKAAKNKLADALLQLSAAANGVRQAPQAKTDAAPPLSCRNPRTPCARRPSGWRRRRNAIRPMAQRIRRRASTKWPSCWATFRCNNCRHRRGNRRAMPGAPGNWPSGWMNWPSTWRSWRIRASPRGRTLPGSSSRCSAPRPSSTTWLRNAPVRAPRRRGKPPHPPARPPGGWILRAVRSRAGRSCASNSAKT